MDVAVGSANPVKRAAVEGALSGQARRIEAVAVDSGVPEQPRGRAETISGAENRARRARTELDTDLGVGIEGGVERLDSGLFLVMWAAVTDGERLEIGSGPSMRLPDDIAEAVADGAELGPLMDDMLGTTNLKHEEGAAGVLTDGIIDREGALTQAVAGAVGPFVSDVY